MIKQNILLLAALLAASLSLGETGAGRNSRPNIVFILADDLGYTDLSCYGSKYYETPNLDRMAKQGIHFTDAHVSAPNCQPSRAALLSGQYMTRTGVYTVGSIERFDWRSQPMRPPARRLPVTSRVSSDCPSGRKRAARSSAVPSEWSEPVQT